MKMHVRLVSLFSLTLLLGLWSCTQTSLELPHSPKGEKGVSAYQQWVDAVNSGKIQWDKGKTSIPDYFIYLKGDEGDRGRSAFAVWQDLLATTDLKNPTNPNESWPKERNTLADFWRYYSGAQGKTPHPNKDGYWAVGNTTTDVLATPKDGKSAYQQWKEDLQAGKIKDWDPNANSEPDFYRYYQRQQGITPQPKSGTWWLGDTDTKVPVTGDNAYEVWKKDVEAGRISTPNGMPWDKSKNQLSDFFSFLKGADGKDGKDAYTLWKEQVPKGIESPTNPGVNWPGDATDKADYYRFLMGAKGPKGNEGPKGETGEKGPKGDKGPSTSGAPGKPGLSAYELWKKELAENAGKPNQIMNKETGTPWPVEENTKDDFYRYLVGRPGKPGADGRPGEPGKPGVDVEVVTGTPNVIAQYHYQPLGEYQRPQDGGVKYKVYGIDGTVAGAGVKVKGMPGMDPEKEYTTDDKGEFIIPRADLPTQQETEARFGRVKSVTFPNQQPMEGAENTYVPAPYDIKLDNSSVPYLSSGSPGYAYCSLYLYCKYSWETEWRRVDSKIPQVDSWKLQVWKITDTQDLTSYSGTTPEYTTSFSSYYATAYGYRPMIKNAYNIIYSSTYTKEWDGNPVYVTAKLDKPIYGVSVAWNSVMEVPPYQIAPRIKTLKLGPYNPTTGTFSEVSGELDVDAVNLDILLYSNSYNTKSLGTGKGNLYTPSYYKNKGGDWQTEAKKVSEIYIRLIGRTSLGVQDVSNDQVKNSLSNTSFAILSPALNATVSVNGYYSSGSTSNENYYGYNLGVLKQKTDGSYYIEKPSNYPATAPDVQVTGGK